RYAKRKYVSAKKNGEGQERDNYGSQYAVLFAGVEIDGSNKRWVMITEERFFTLAVLTDILDFSSIHRP
ncbi:hypothetical protein OAM69_01895, partial [bacterium]|nr:hypothetical protein [bacterium]